MLFLQQKQLLPLRRQVRQRREPLPFRLRRHRKHLRHFQRPALRQIDARRQALNVARMRMLGAEVVEVTLGDKILKDAITL